MEVQIRMFHKHGNQNTCQSCLFLHLDWSKSHATSVDSQASRSKDDGPSEVVPRLQSEHEASSKQNSYIKRSECESWLNASSQQREARKVDETKGSLADWGVVACVFLSNFIAAIDFTGFAVLFPYLVEHFDARTAAVGWCSSISGFFQALVALFATYPIKSYGCRFPGAVGCLLLSLGMSLSYLAPNLTTIYFTYGVIGGSGSGLALLSTSIIIHQRFTRNRNLASGIGSLGFSCGAMIGSILSDQIIQSFGWRGSFLVLGAIQAQRIPLCLFFRTPKTLTSKSNHASGVGQRRLYGNVILRYLKETFNFSIFRHARYSVYCTACLLQLFCLSGYLPHTVNRAAHVGLTRHQGVIATTLISISSSVTRATISFIANLPKVKSTLVFAVGMFFAFLSIVVIFINPGLVGTMTSAAMFGMHLGCTNTVFAIVAVELMGVALLPKSLAIVQFIGGFPRLIAAPLIGWVFDVTRDYSKAFAIIGCMAFASSSLMVILTFLTRCYQMSVAKHNEIPHSDNGAANPLTSEG